MKTTADNRSESGWRRHTWRFALAGGALATLAGGANHPEGPNDQGTRIELATMMEDDAWYWSHAVIAIGATLFLIGIWGAERIGAWRPHLRETRFLRVAQAAFAFEAVVHIFAAVDADRLRSGDFAPFAYAHLGLAFVIYPIMGGAIIWLAAGLVRTWPVPARVFAAAAIVGGIATGLSVPLALLTDIETDPLFMLGGMLPALWLLVAAIVGARSGDTVDLTRDERVSTGAMA